MSEREDILNDEFMRETPGMRPFSVGILILCRTLGLEFALKSVGEARVLTQAQRDLELVTLGWLLDERNALATVRSAPAMAARRKEENGPSELDEVLAAYGFTIAPDYLVAVQMELRRTEAAMTAAAVEVSPKPALPGAKPPPTPPPN